jgi:formylmethanofuran dehydrogenase subunit E
MVQSDEEIPQPMVQCKKCGRAVWTPDVNKAGNCVICSPPHAHKADGDEPDEAPAA